MQSGELRISNHSDANVGSYACEARNSVGSASCRYALHAYNRKSFICPEQCCKFCHFQIFTQLTPERKG